MELYHACKAGDLTTVIERLEAGEDVNEVYNTGNDFLDDGITHLMGAAMYGHIAVVKTLVDRGADLEARDINGFTALMLAVYDTEEIHTHGIDVAKELLKQGSTWSSVNDRYETFLDFLSEEARQMMEDFIIDLECELEDTGVLDSGAECELEDTGVLDSGAEYDSDFY